VAFDGFNGAFCGGFRTGAWIPVELPARAAGESLKHLPPVLHPTVAARKYSLMLRDLLSRARQQAFLATNF
jgi:hypothetical protein